MVAKAREHCAGVENIETLLEDARLIDLEQADLIVSYYTMQFIAPRYRQELFDKIYEALNWGGAFILFEKVRGPDVRFQDICTQLYNDFKIRNGLPRCSPRELKLMANMLIIGILVNAFVCGGVSQPADRYGARVAFLLPLGLAFLQIFLQRHRAKATKVGE